MKKITFSHALSFENLIKMVVFLQCTESKDLPALQFNFLNIANIEKIEPDQLVGMSDDL